MEDEVEKINDEKKEVVNTLNEKSIISYGDIIKFFYGGLAMGIIYLICFANKLNDMYFYLEENFYLLKYNLASTVFVALASIILIIVLKLTNNLNNKKGLVFLIPINILGISYFFLMGEFFRVANLIVILVLFAVCTLATVSKWKVNFKFLIMQIIGNWTIFTKIFHKDKDDEEYRKEIGSLMKVGKGILISTPFLIVILSLLIIGDSVFGIFVDNALINLFQKLNIRAIIMFIIIMVYSTGVIPAAIKNSHLSKMYNKNKIVIDTTVCSTFLIMINLLFIVYMYVQLNFLFNDGFMGLPSGSTYANYARDGFFALLQVTFINFAIMYFFIEIVSKPKSKIIKTLLFILCLFTVILMISSGYRMYLYIIEYGFTMLRLAVITFLGMECFLLIITIRALILKNDENYLKQFILIAIIFYIIANFTSSYFMQTTLNLKMLEAGYIDEVEINNSSAFESAGSLSKFLENKEYIYNDGKVHLRSKEDENKNNDDPYEIYDIYKPEISWKNKFFKY